MTFWMSLDHDPLHGTLSVPLHYCHIPSPVVTGDRDMIHSFQKCLFEVPNGGTGSQLLPIDYRCVISMYHTENKAGSLLKFQSTTY